MIADKIHPYICGRTVAVKYFTAKKKKTQALASALKLSRTISATKSHSFFLFPLQADFACVMNNFFVQQCAMSFLSQWSAQVLTEGASFSIMDANSSGWDEKFCYQFNFKKSEIGSYVLFDMYETILS